MFTHTHAEGIKMGVTVDDRESTSSLPPNYATVLAVPVFQELPMYMCTVQVMRNIFQPNFNKFKPQTNR